jgi:hypothetical protein
MMKAVSASLKNPEQMFARLYAWRDGAAAAGMNDVAHDDHVLIDALVPKESGWQGEPHLK